MWLETKNKKYGVVIWQYNGNAKYGLRLELGDTVHILEENAGWFRGYCLRNKNVKGIFPSKCISLKAFHLNNEGQYETVTPVEDLTAQEVSCLLREWSIIWQKLYITRENHTFLMLRQAMLTLIEWRKQLLGGNLTQDQTREVKNKITSKIDFWNKKLGLDLVPRIESEIVDPEKISVIELYDQHVQSSLTTGNTSSRGTFKKAAIDSTNHHIYLCLRDLRFNLGEDIEIFFSLYDARQNHFLSERFQVNICKEGFHNFEKLQSSLFVNLGNADLNRDLYLVANIIRIGRMLLNESKKAVSHSYRRPYGCAVLSMAEVLHDNSDSEEREFNLKAFQCNENDFYQLHDFLIKKQSNKYNLLSGQTNYGFMISLKIIHGTLDEVKKNYPTLVKSATLTRKRWFSDVIMPGDVRNDLYLSMEMAEFEKGGKNVGKNVEATVVVVDQDGEILQKCVIVGSGQDPVIKYNSFILYHNNVPHWGEIIKLEVPIDRFNGAHIRIDFKHCSTRDKCEKLFGFCFAPLMDDVGILTDGLHHLVVYKCEDKQKLCNPKNYLGLPSFPPANGSAISNSYFQRSPKESAIVSTLLCSTKLTQNVDLQALLKWKSHPDKIDIILRRFMELDGEEIVKFLQDVLDQLFSMFSTNDGSSTQHSGLVFQVLIHTFSLLKDSKFEHFQPVLDKYITDHFAAALVYKGLLSSIRRYADLTPAVDSQEDFLKCFSSLEYLFKFIIQSWLLFSRATGGQNDSFKMDLYLLFSSFNKLLSISFKNIINSQVALIRSFSKTYNELRKVLPEQELGKIIKTLIDNLPIDVPPVLIRVKMEYLRETVKSRVFANSESRLPLLEMCTRHLKLHLTEQHEIKLCGEVLGDILTLLHQQQSSCVGVNSVSIQHDIEVVALSLLDPLIDLLTVVDRSCKADAQLVSCLIGLLRLMNENHYRRLWDEFREKRPLMEFLLKVFVVFGDLVNPSQEKETFPKDWLTLKLVVNNVIFDALQEFSQLLNIDFLEGCSFDQKIWNQYFTLAVAFLTQPCLQLETFSELKKDKITKRYGDMRVLMGFQILTMWSSLGEHKINFIPAMVGPFLEVTLVPETELRKATLPIFFDMIDCEQKHRGTFRQVESELIDKLDILVSENKGDDEYRELFNTILLARVKQNDPKWKQNGTTFINSVTLLLERLLDYRNVMKGDENKDKRMSCTVNLLNFYKNEVNRKEMYIRYIYKLCDLHLSAEHFTEAAFTLKLDADLLTWGNRTLHANLRYPTQREWQRREMIIQKIIEYFDKGKCWEKGIPFCKELANFYEKKLYSYSKLSSILQTQAKFYDNILSTLRPPPEYFRVGFYGMSFPLFVRNKVFIYRGLEYERIEAFTQRLQTEFPTAQAMMKNTPPDESVMNSDSQYIQICNVRPVPEELPELEGVDIPDKVLSYYLVNDVRKFLLDRPVHKGTIDKENEFKSLWIERTTLVISEPLPSILRWFEVVEKTVVDLSPIEVACETVEKMNKELRHLISQYTADPKRTISPLSMRLQGVIDSAVNGGIAKYQEAFFCGNFSIENPDHSEHISILKASIIEQVQILEGGLSLHDRLAPPEVRPLHDRLVELFSSMKHEIKDSSSPSMRLSISSLASSTSYSSNSSTRSGRKSEQHDTGEYRKPTSIINQPLPPLPTEVKNISVYNRSVNKPVQSIGKLPPDLPNSNRCSSSSGASSTGIYGHFSQEISEDESPYDKPCLRASNSMEGTRMFKRPKSTGSETKGIRLPTRTMSNAETRPNSNIYKQPRNEKNSQSQAVSPKLSSKMHHPSPTETNAKEIAPPLPPRG
ncbi:Dedicator of cytokinesis protein 3 [Nymphon striatum]|nr:Dedicator of cytokinesis protein 3 [Nymphon striatum]